MFILVRSHEENEKRLCAVLGGGKSVYLTVALWIEGAPASSRHGYEMRDWCRLRMEVGSGSLPVFSEEAVFQCSVLGRLQARAARQGSTKGQRQVGVGPCWVVE